MKPQNNKITGTISVTAKGVGYVSNLDLKEDIEIDFKHLKTALNGDKVEVLPHPKGRFRQTGEVLKILERAKENFVGVLEKEDQFYFVRPDDSKMYADILISKENLGGAKVGQKVFTKITFWEDSRKSPEGKILKVLGNRGEHRAEMASIILEKGIESDFPPEVEKEAKKIKAQGISEADLKKRRDFRKILTFTIDPSDAKDFDDAISFREVGPDLFEVGVHIADVSHFVKIGSQIDQEAVNRATSVYLVDRTIPMLPEVLSNDLCSLVPHQDRLTFSSVFVLDLNAKIKSSWFGQSVINSQKRFTYEEAEATLKNKNAELHRELSILNKIAKTLSKERHQKGAISIEQEEVKFVLDKEGKPIKVIKKERGDSNKLIEELMLLANKEVAKLFSKNKTNPIFVYRVHDLPSKEKMEDLAFFLKSMGHKVKMKEGLIENNTINKILLDLEGKAERGTIGRAITRSMAKAIYSTKNIGHYGLAFEDYTHFTSPIRRYPDILVHRLLSDLLENKKTSKEKIKIFDRLASHSSEREKRASDAERASVKYKQAEYMSKRIGQTFSGMISGVSEWGIYVEELETKAEGLIRVRDMKDDFYLINEKKMEMVGERKKKRYRFGDYVKIKVKAVDLERKTIDYTLV